MEWIKPERIWLNGQQGVDEKWIQQQIADDPKILGLGELILKDKERMQPKAGRLDLLLQDPETYRRYEVEVQLGKTDESHIIRTIEYWDVEKKRFPQYDHCAVIVAEEITGRFLNVISLFNGFIPLIAIQMVAMRYEGKHALMFTTVLDEQTFGFEEDDGVNESTDRKYWETKRGTRESVALVDDLLKLVKSFAPQYDLKYNKAYIGLAKGGKANNFVYFTPTKKHILMNLKLRQSEETAKRIVDADLDLVRYDKPFGTYIVRITRDDVATKSQSLTELFKLAATEYE